MKIRDFALKRLAPAMFAMCALSAHAGNLVVNTDASDPAPKAAFGKLVKGFEAANPDVTVKVNTFDHEGYKTSIRNFLTAEAPDVVDLVRRQPHGARLSMRDCSKTCRTCGPSRRPGRVAQIRRRVDDHRRQEVGRALHLLPVGHVLPQGHLRQAGHRRAQELGGTAGRQRQAERKQDHAVRHRHQSHLDHRRLVRLPEPARQRLRVPHGPDRRARCLTPTSASPPCSTSGTNWSSPATSWTTTPSYQWQEALPAFVKGEAAMYLMGNFAVAPMKRSRPEGRADRLHAVPGNHQGHADGRRRADRHRAHPGQSQKQGRCAQVPGLHGQRQSPRRA